MELSRRQQAALVAICDTFAPGLDGLPAASEAGVPEEFVGALERHPRESEVRDILRLLSGTVKPSKGGKTSLVFESDFAPPLLSRPE